MMFADVVALFDRVPVFAATDEYERAVVLDNCLAKPSKKARQLAFRHLLALYGLNNDYAIFRALRRLWIDAAARPVLALTISLARDPLLRATQSLIEHKKPGERLPRDEMEEALDVAHPNRFSAASLRSFAQNVNGTWTDAGFLVGSARKTRATPMITPANMSFALFLAYLEGRSGQRLFSSHWVRLLNQRPDEQEALAESASHRGLLVFLHAGGVKEVRFPGYLTPEEQRLRDELANVENC
jgi:hypothetical protein